MDSLGAIISPGKKLIVLSLQNPPPTIPTPSSLVPTKVGSPSQGPGYLTRSPSVTECVLCLLPSFQAGPGLLCLWPRCPA